jgi:diphthine-ammonia ligase
MMQKKMQLGVLFSGGKDSVFACWRAMKKESVSCLITLKSRNDESYMFHTPNIHLTSMQAEAAGIPLLEYPTQGEEEKELVDLENAIAAARDRYEIDGIVTGAILSVYQATRIQRICHELDLCCYNPLWHINQEEYLKEIIAEGFETIISGVFSSPFDASWLGRTLDASMIDELKLLSEKWKISLTGEGGELETLVVDAPFFSKRIRITSSERMYANYNGRYLITGAELVEK